MTKRGLVERLHKLAKIEGDLIRAIDKHSISAERHGAFTYIPEDKLREIAQDLLKKLDKLK